MVRPVKYINVLYALNYLNLPSLDAASSIYFIYLSPVCAVGADSTDGGKLPDLFQRVCAIQC